MVQVIGVKFRNAGKIYYFDPGEEQIARGMSVIVETSRGTELGMVVMPNTEMEEEQVVQPLKPIIRVAVTEDFDVIRAHKEKEKEAYKICQEKIREHELEMKLVDVEYTFDGSKLMFYFTADGRVDFRELVKDLASVFKMRIELRQIGVRDETKILGGIGICGRSLCCHSYLSDFIPVSIKMAKEQSLSLNPTKISGVCGRLMCCLKNEEDTYEYLNKQLPRIGEMVTVTAEGEEGEVQSVNVLRQRVKLLVRGANDDTELKEYPVEELDFGPDRKRPEPRPETARFKEESDAAPQKKDREQPARAARRSGRGSTPQRERENEPRHRENAGKSSGNRPERRTDSRTERRERPERAERVERPEKTERTERSERGERIEHTERQDHPKRQNRRRDYHRSGHNQDKNRQAADKSNS